MHEPRTRQTAVSALALLVAILLLHMAAPAHAQEAEPSSTAATSAIPVSDVAERADALATQLREARALVAPRPDVETISRTIDQRGESLAERAGATMEALAELPTLSQLSELERDWAVRGNDLVTRRLLLEQRADAVDATLTRLRTAEQIWAGTLEEIRGDGAVPEVLEVVRASLADIREVRTLAEERRSALFALQNRVSQQQRMVTASLESVRDSRERVLGRLFDPDQPPIWAAVARAERGPAERIVSVLASGRAEVATYLDQRRGRLISLAALFVLAWIAALSLKRTIGPQPHERRHGADPSRVFLRPLASASLVALLSVFWLFPLAPDVLFDLVGLLALIPMLRLLPALVHPGLRGMLYGLAAFYVVDRLRDLFEGATIEGRIAFALECVAAAALCFTLLRPSRLDKIPEPEKLPRWPGYALRAALGGFAIALVANLLGYFALARLLGDGILTSTYIAVGVYAGTRVAGIVITGAMHTSRAQEMRAIRAIPREWVHRTLGIVSVTLWAYWSLAAFAIQDAVIGGLRSVLAAPLTLGTISVSLGDVLVFAIAVTLAIGSARVVRFVLLEDVFPRVPTARGVPHAASATAYYLVLFGGLLLALAAAGIDFSQFALLAGALGVGIGFGLQNVVNNFVSGIILLFERPIQVGDTIDLNGLWGEVRRIGIRSSTVRSFDGAEVIVPNSDLISQRVVNWTLSDKLRRITLHIGVKYGTDPAQVLGILREIADSHPLVLKTPAPLTLFRAHGSSSLDFELRVWILFDDFFVVETELNEAINRSLAEAGIEIPFPQRDLHVRSVDPGVGRILGQDGARGRPAIDAADARTDAALSR